MIDPISGGGIDRGYGISMNRAFCIVAFVDFSQEREF